MVSGRWIRNAEFDSTSSDGSEADESAADESAASEGEAGVTDAADAYSTTWTDFAVLLVPSSYCPATGEATFTAGDEGSVLIDIAFPPGSVLHCMEAQGVAPDGAPVVLRSAVVPADTIDDEVACAAGPERDAAGRVNRVVARASVRVEGLRPGGEGKVAFWALLPATSVRAIHSLAPLPLLRGKTAPPFLRLENPFDMPVDVAVRNSLGLPLHDSLFVKDAPPVGERPLVVEGGASVSFAFSAMEGPLGVRWGPEGGQSALSFYRQPRRAPAADHVLFLIDISGSMGDTMLMLMEAFKIFLSELAPGTVAKTVVFGTSAPFYGTSSWAAFPPGDSWHHCSSPGADAAALTPDWCLQGGSTPMGTSLAAVREMFSRLPSGGRRRFLFATDGVPDAGPETELTEQMIGTFSVPPSFLFIGGEPPALLHRLARGLCAACPARPVVVPDGREAGALASAVFSLVHGEAYGVTLGTGGKRPLGFGDVAFMAPAGRATAFLRGEALCAPSGALVDSATLCPGEVVAGFRLGSRAPVLEPRVLVGLTEAGASGGTSARELEAPLLEASPGWRPLLELLGVGLALKRLLVELESARLAPHAKAEANLLLRDLSLSHGLLLGPTAMVLAGRRLAGLSFLPDLSRPVVCRGAASPCRRTVFSRGSPHRRQSPPPRGRRSLRARGAPAADDEKLDYARFLLAIQGSLEDGLRELGLPPDTTALVFVCACHALFMESLGAAYATVLNSQLSAAAQRLCRPADYGLFCSLQGAEDLRRTAPAYIAGARLASSKR